MPGIGYGNAFEPTPEEQRKWRKQEQREKTKRSIGCLAAIVLPFVFLRVLSLMNKETASQVFWGVVLVAVICYVIREICRSFTED